MRNRGVILGDLLSAPMGRTARAEMERGRYLLDLARQMARRCADAGKIISKLGTQDDFVQQIVLVLLAILSGEQKFDLARGISFEGYVLNEVRILAMRNCLVFDRLGLDEEDVGELPVLPFEPVENADECALMEQLSPRERIFAKCSPAGLAKLVGQTDRNIRLERAKIAKRLQSAINAAPRAWPPVALDASCHPRGSTPPRRPAAPDLHEKL